MVQEENSVGASCTSFVVSLGQGTELFPKSGCPRVPEKGIISELFILTNDFSCSGADDWVSKIIDMWFGSWLAPFGEKEIGSGRGGSITGKSMEGILGDEVRDLDVDRWVFVHWYGRYGDDDSVIIFVVKVGVGEEDVWWSLSLGVGGCGWTGRGGATGVFLVGFGDGSCDGGVGAVFTDVLGMLGLRRGEPQGSVGTVVRPGVLRRVTRVWRRGVVRRMRGAVGLLDRVGSTLEGGAVWVFTLGACWELSW